MKTNSKVKEILVQNNKISKVILDDGTDVVANNYIICAGGMGFPRTGSTGDGYKWAKDFGHNLKEPKPALAPVKIKESWVKNAQGLSLKNVQINVFENNYVVPMAYNSVAKAGGGVAESAPAPTIQPGQQEIDVSINLTYQVK